MNNDELRVHKKTIDYIERLRAEKMTLAQIARGIGVDYVTIYRWRAGILTPCTENFLRLQELVEKLQKVDA